jgi:hypothetical protein
VNINPPYCPFFFFVLTINRFDSYKVNPDGTPVLDANGKIKTFIGKVQNKYLDPIFEAEGFQRKKDTWYWHTDECICFFLTKKSPYGFQFDHVMGCFVKRVYGSDQEFPPFNKANIKYSLREMKDREWVQQTFDLSDNSFKNDERESPRLAALKDDCARLTPPPPRTAAPQ